MIKGIVDIINEQITGMNNSQVIYGIAQPIIRTLKDNKRELFPGIYDKYGEAKPIVIDDIYSLVTYHKMNSVNTARVAGTGYGDDREEFRNTYQMSLFAYWDMRKINVLQDEMMLILQARVSGKFTIPDLRAVHLDWASTNFNSMQVFASEYQPFEFKIPGNINLMSMAYTVQIIFNQGCIKNCP